MNLTNLLAPRLRSACCLPLLGLAACGSGDVQFGPEHRVAAAQRPMAFGQDQRDRFGLQDMAAPRSGGTDAAGAASPPGFEGDVPADWQALPPSDMRQLNYRVAGNAAAECYLTARNLGGGMLANVNRWVQSQFGQAPLSPAQFAALPRFALLGHPAVLVSVEGTFTGGMGGAAGDDFKLLGLIGGSDDDMVTLKFTGPRAVVDAQRDAFLAFAASIRPAANQKAGAGAAPSPTAAGFHAATPAGWQVAPPSEFRQLNWRVGGDPDAECYLTAGNLRGGTLMNVNRWVASQFGQEPLTEAQFAALPRLPLLGQPAVLVSVEGSFNGGMTGTPRDDFKLLGLVGGSDDAMVTLKFTGPRAIVDAQRDAFLQLAASIQRGPGAGSSGANAGPGGAGSSPAPTPPPDATHAGVASSPFDAKMPADWIAMGDTGSRLLRHRFGSKGECYVGQLGGDLAAMLGIWCGEMSAATPDAAAIAALPKVAMLGAEATLLDLTGSYTSMGGQSMSDARSLVAVVQDGNGITFAKCLGPAAEVEAQRAAFLAFVTTLRRTP